MNERKLLCVQKVPITVSRAKQARKFQPTIELFMNVKFQTQNACAGASFEKVRCT